MIMKTLELKEPIFSLQLGQKLMGLPTMTISIKTEAEDLPNKINNAISMG